MTVHLDKRDLPDRLEYRVTKQLSRTELLLRISAWVAALFFPMSAARESLVFALALGGFLLYASINDVRRARRGTDVSLIVTERDIISDGYTHDEYFPINRWRVQAPDLAWKEQRSSDEEPTYPQGIYCGSDCVLPLVTMQEGHHIITAIYSRYPDTASESRYDSSAVPSPIITLSLSNN